MIESPKPWKTRVTKAVKVTANAVTNSAKAIAQGSVVGAKAIAKGTKLAVKATAFTFRPFDVRDAEALQRHLGYYKPENETWAGVFNRERKLKDLELKKVIILDAIKKSNAFNLAQKIAILLRYTRSGEFDFRLKMISEFINEEPKNLNLTNYSVFEKIVSLGIFNGKELELVYSKLFDRIFNLSSGPTSCFTTLFDNKEHILHMLKLAKLIEHDYGKEVIPKILWPILEKLGKENSNALILKEKLILMAYWPRKYIRNTEEVKHVCDACINGIPLNEIPMNLIDIMRGRGLELRDYKAEPRYVENRLLYLENFCKRMKTLSELKRAIFNAELYNVDIVIPDELFAHLTLEQLYELKPYLKYGYKHLVTNGTKKQQNYFYLSSFLNGEFLGTIDFSEINPNIWCNPKFSKLIPKKVIYNKEYLQDYNQTNIELRLLGLLGEYELSKLPGLDVSFIKVKFGSILKSIFDSVIENDLNFNFDKFIFVLNTFGNLNKDERLVSEFLSLFLEKYPLFIKENVKGSRPKYSGNLLNRIMNYIIKNRELFSDTPGMGRVYEIIARKFMNLPKTSESIDELKKILLLAQTSYSVEGDKLGSKRISDLLFKHHWTHDLKQ